MAATVGLDITSWENFWSRWAEVLAQIPDAKQRMLADIGDQLTESVRRKIVESGVNDSFGRVQSWQQPRVGTRLGYVAVAPTRDGAIAGSSSAPAGAITNYLETGHSIREPSGRSRRYQPRIQVPRVRAYRFYQAEQPDADRIGRSAAEAFLQKLEASLK
jgi:hypothetical protein